jgi:hypothetical protein
MATDVQVTVQDDSGVVVITDISEAGSVSVIEEQQVVVEDQSIIIVTEGQQGPTGPQGPAGVSGAAVLVLEAGEDLAVGDPVRVSTNKFYIADSTTNFRVVAVVTTAALTGLSATATLMGPAALSGLSAGSPYFLGAGIITTVAPASGYVIRLGQAVSDSTLLLNIEEPVLLA